MSSDLSVAAALPAGPVGCQRAPGSPWAWHIRVDGMCSADKAYRLNLSDSMYDCEVTDVAVGLIPYQSRLPCVCLAVYATYDTVTAVAAYG